MVILEELIVLFAFEILYMEGNRYVFEGVDFLSLIVALNVAEEGLFVAEVPIIL